jgi:hypothetical protein
MNRKIVAGVALALITLVAVLSVVGCGSAPTPTTGSVPDAYATWYSSGTGIGYTDFQAVQSDLNTLNTDTNNGDVFSMQSDGTALAMDATTALQVPLPVDDSVYPNAISGDYITMMGSLEQAGQDIATGNYTGATSLLELSSGLANTISAALNTAAGN